MKTPAHFGDDITNQTNNTDANANNMGAMMICSRLAGRAIIRVVGRCEDAQENNNLDLSECQLMQVPDAVYHLMRHTELKTCDLSGNVITKIPPKFATNFSLITDLNLSNNQMAKLPDELVDLGSLERLDISHNTYIALPNVVFKIPKLSRLFANNNHITDVDTDKLRNAPSLQELDLSSNPLLPRSHDRLKALTCPMVKVSDREEEGWDLNV